MCRRGEPMNDAGTGHGDGVEHGAREPDLGSGPIDEEYEYEAPWDRSLYPHPEWTVGLILVAAGITLLFGLLVDPIWLLVGSPFLMVLALYLWVRIVALPRRERAARAARKEADRRRPGSQEDDGAGDPAADPGRPPPTVDEA